VLLAASSPNQQDSSPMSDGSEHGQHGRLPDFIVIGAAKAGTTSLHFYPSLHPEIFMSTPKVPRFFADAPEPLGRWHPGEVWYRRLFVTTKRLAGETSPTYAAAAVHLRRACADCSHVALS
jgi:hypothetical protein